MKVIFYIKSENTGTSCPTKKVTNITNVTNETNVTNVTKINIPNESKETQPWHGGN